MLRPLCFRACVYRHFSEGSLPRNVGQNNEVQKVEKNVGLDTTKNLPLNVGQDNQIQKVERSAGLDTTKTRVPWDEWQETHRHMKLAKEKSDFELYIDLRDKLIQTVPKFLNRFVYEGGVIKWLKERTLERKRLSQRFIPSRVDALGPDLAAAYFVISRGGLVKFEGREDWVGRREKPMLLPATYMAGYYVEAIDASEMDLLYEGVECIYDLKKLKWLSLRGLKSVDNFALDIISGRYGPQLHYLDLSGCDKIDHFGLSCFYRFKQLKVLNVAGLNHTNDFKLSCLMIQDLLPDLEIIGIDFDDVTDLEENMKQKETLDHKERVTLLN